VIELLGDGRAKATTTIHEIVRGVATADGSVGAIGDEINVDRYAIYHDELAKFGGEWKFTQRISGAVLHRNRRRRWRRLRKSTVAPTQIGPQAVRARSACATNAKEGSMLKIASNLSGAVPEMEEGPPGSPCRGRSQTTAGCVGQEPGW
jgi:hypothetical protein